MIRISIVAMGAFVFSLLREGVKAEARTSATSAVLQAVVMLSGNKGESRMKTSLGERRPRIDADAKSSFFRVDPR